MKLIKKFKEYDEYTKKSIFLIIFFLVIVFSLASIHHVSGDSCWHLSAAKFISENGKIPLNEGIGRDEPFWAPPLFHIIASFVYSIFKSDFLIKFVSPIMSVLTLIFVFFIAKKLYDSKVAFYSLLFLSFIPMFIDYSILSYVEMTLMFFIVLSIYFSMNNKVVLSAISLGLGILTKYNAVFIIPLLIFIHYKNNNFGRSIKKNFRFNKKIISGSLILFFVPLIIASPWLIRNYFELGNPVWPFLNFIFNGFEKLSYSSLDLSRLINPQLIVYTYLGLFGVPDGNPSNLFFFNIPFMKILIGLWLMGTAFFLLPLFFSKKNKNKRFLLIWFFSFFALFLVYVVNVGFSVTRIIIPAIPVIAIIWANGFSKLMQKKYSKIFFIIILLICLGFVFSEFVKFGLAARQWNKYDDDFNWIIENTAKNSIFAAGGQCVRYNLNRETIYPEYSGFDSADYVFVNQRFNLDRRVVLDKELLKELESKDYSLVYSNEKTETKIYKVK